MHHRLIFRPLAIISLMMTILLSTAHASEYFEGVHYKLIPQAQQHVSSSPKVEEFFSYTCPHCHRLEPFIQQLKPKLQAKGITFEAIPAVFNHPNWVFMANVYHSFQHLDIIDQVHTSYFKALHEQNKKLFDPNSIAREFQPFGLTPEKMDSAMKSFVVMQKTSQAQRLGEDYGIQSVPSIVINGKYQTSVSMAGSEEELEKLIWDLTKKND